MADLSERAQVGFFFDEFVMNRNGDKFCPNCAQTAQLASGFVSLKKIVMNKVIGFVSAAASVAVGVALGQMVYNKFLNK